MYPSRGNGAYGQPNTQPYSLGSTGHHYGGQYSVYGSTSHNSGLQADIYDRLDAANALRQELLHTASIDGSSRQADYLAARAGTILPYGGRIDPDLHTPILGAASRREVEDMVYARGSANPGYGVSLPPGRDYVQGRSLPGIFLESPYAREIERREEDRCLEILRERERRRERERILERRERVRERERISRDRGRSTSAKGGRSARRRSLVKEKRREYVCKVYTSNLVAAERDYLSMDKRYSRLYVSPDCSKVIVNWSKNDLNIPFNTPISFEHDFMLSTSSEDDSASTKTVTNGQVKLESGATRWKAKMLLMSGLSRNAWEELSSERKYEDRIPHLCNMLRFACLKDGNSLMAIGGSCDDSLVNQSTLIQTVLRCAKDLTGLDLKNCRNWNPFLEIHYDRVGKDGLFSHKEITVLYIPDLSDCLPSIDAWRDQWLAHKKAIAERERLQALKKEKSREKKEVSKDKEPKTKNNVEKEEKKKEAETVAEGGNSGKKNEADNASGDQKSGSGKKIIKKVKKDAAENATKQDDTNTEVVNEDGDKIKTVKTTNKIVKKVVKKKVASIDVSKDEKPETKGAGPQDVGGLTEVGNKSEKVEVKEEKKAKVEGGSDKNEKSKGGKENKDKDDKFKRRGKEVKDEKKAEEPPKHPGLILQTKGNKNSKLRSLSLSLDSLLDYTDKDTEESTFELSVFAETFYEMLQYQMGSRILAFLQKLRVKYVAKRNKKRQREEASDKKKEKTKKSSSPKRLKTDATDKIETVKDEKDMVVDDVENKKEDKPEKDEGSEEESEEDFEEDEHVADASPKNDAENEEKAEVDKVEMDLKSEKKGEKEKKEENVKGDAIRERKENLKFDMKKKEKSVAIDKELLQAFRFFDRNRAGYVRVEDLRLILHALGKCLSHRDVKELVQSALLESNTGRDDQILYNKLVKMTDF